MKNTFKSLLAAVVIVSASAIGANAQVTASASAAATIVTPITISKDIDMNFGNVAVSSSAGTVVLAPNGSRSLTGGVTLPVNSGTVAAAKFTVAGEAGYTYAITLPSSALTISSGNNNMTVTNFTSNPSGTGTLTGGTSTLNIGATLNVAGNQPAGTYTSATPFDVTVNYN